METLNQYNGAGDVELVQKALFIDIILDRIFEYVVSGKEGHVACFSKDVQCIRLVCRRWRNRMTKVVRKVMPPIRFGNPCNNDELEFDGSRSAEAAAKMRKFMDLIKDAPVIPVERYIIAVDIFMAENSPHLITDFMEICGAEATEIIFDMNWNLGIDFSIEHWKETANLRLPKLKRFYIDTRIDLDQNNPYEVVYKNDGVFDLIELVLKGACNLEDFSFSLGVYEEDDEKLKQRMNEIYKLLPRGIKTLKISDSQLIPSQLKILAEKYFQLKKLDITLKYSVNKDLAPINKFLLTQTETLKEIVLTTDSTKSLVRLLPSMKKVERLKFSSPHELIGDRAVATSNFFPNLQVLDLEDVKPHRQMQLFLSSKNVSLSVKELLLPKSEKFLDFSYDLLNPPVSNYIYFPFVKMAAQCFPNLTKLSLYLPKKTRPDHAFQDIFSYLHGLEELSVKDNLLATDILGTKDGLNLEIVLSGITPKEYKRLSQMNRFTHEKLDNSRKQASILDLTKLRKLVLDNFMCNEHCSEEHKFTRFSAHFLFSQMPDLQELHMRGLKVTDEFSSILRRKLKVLEICTSESDSTSDSDF